MSRAAESADDTSAAICEYCGFVIDEAQKDCPALDDGRCQA
jgi:hypothetical protein